MNNIHNLCDCVAECRECPCQQFYIHMKPDTREWTELECVQCGVKTELIQAGDKLIEAVDAFLEDYKHMRPGLVKPSFNRLRELRNKDES